METILLKSDCYFPNQLVTCAWLLQIADNLENVLHQYPDNGDDDLAEDYHHSQQYRHDIDADYEHQYYSNQ